MKITLFLLLFLVPTLLLAQSDFNRLKGKVQDGETSEDLPFVHITYAGNQFGTTTNAEGAFQIKIPNDRQQDTLVFSYMGYESYRLPILQIELSDSTLVIALKPAVFDLPTVEVKPVSALDIIVKTITNIPMNYRQEDYQLEGFYREVGDQIAPATPLIFSEGVIEIDKGFFKKNRNRIQDAVYIKKGYRKKLDYLLKKGEETYQIPPVTQGAHVAVWLDVVRNSDFILTESNYKKYEYEYAGIKMLDKEEILIIKFQPRDPTSRSAYVEGELEITSSTYALVGANYSFTDHGVKLFDQFDQTKLNLKERHFRVRYYPYEGHWYIQSASVDQVFQDSESLLEIDMEMDYITTSVQLNQGASGHKRKKKKDRIRFDEAFSEMVGEIGDEFWEDYNILEREQ